MSFPMSFLSSVAIREHRFKSVVIVGVLALLCTLAACGKSNTVASTADRVKLVDERQKTDPNFYQPIAPRAADAKPSLTGTAYAATPADSAAKAPGKKR